MEADWLFEEYKIVQAKIDKLGEDMFKVRSWCITLFTGVAVGAKFSGGFSISVPLILFPIVLAFQLIEYRQRQISRRSIKQLRNIEAKVRHSLRKAGRGLFSAPNFGTRLLADGVKDNKNRTVRSWIRGKFNKSSNEPNEKGEESERSTPIFLHCLVAHADFWFYVVQYSIILGLLCAACFHKREVNPALTLQLGTNSLSLTSENTNLITTNYIIYTKQTTNFVEARVFTTNFVVTNIITTNFIRSSP